MMTYLVTYEVMDADISPIVQKMMHITLDPNANILDQIRAELRKTVPRPVYVVAYEEEVDDDDLMLSQMDCWV
jgi:hypothetical protein